MLTTLVATTGACSSDDETGNEVSRNGNPSGGTGSLTLVPRGGVGAGMSATIEGAGSGNCTIIPDEDGCTGTAYEGESIPLDIYIMFDQSGSMSSCLDPATDAVPCADPENTATRINAIRTATETFLRDRASAGISVGIGYFGHQDIGATTCAATDYTSAAVPIGELPAHADAVMASLNSAEPTGETPTGPAIEGACEYAQDWKREHPNRKVVLLFITDGEPKAPVTCAGDTGPCCPTLDAAVAAATECRTGDPGIETYVIGVGPFLDNLAEIAESGGTERAYLVQEGNVADEVLNALNAIRGDATIPCNLSIPAPPDQQTLNYDQVNIIHADPACNGTVFGYVTEASGCQEHGGWYYDNPDAPSTIQLCPTSCELVGIPGSDLLLSVGCDTYVEIY